MVLVAVDDLLFRSKISSAAKVAGVEIKAATSRDAVLQRARELRPQLIIFDLDSARIEPLQVLQQLAQDPDLAQVPTIAFVSHVHADLIRAARASGVGEVLARSAFVAALPAILARHGTAPDNAVE